jgi:hypothetical protein
MFGWLPDGESRRLARDGLLHQQGDGAGLLAHFIWFLGFLPSVLTSEVGLYSDLFVLQSLRQVLFFFNQMF